ncbi:MAG: DUF3311 domain-containing protein [Pyrinomonadaceae bacterium MAG19_C2-C3]|nr:DUF3311 domain-containing protein [Pyrinomonadaceae bacterium MAG19_C2-C3]
MKRALLIACVIILYLLHQDFWFWRTARPFVFGFIPIGLFYHACFSVAATLLMWLLVKHAYPTHIEREIEQLDLRAATSAGLANQSKEDAAP